jgi:hypothetical protein
MDLIQTGYRLQVMGCGLRVAGLEIKKSTLKTEIASAHELTPMSYFNSCPFAFIRG